MKKMTHIVELGFVLPSSRNKYKNIGHYLRQFNYDYGFVLSLRI